MADFPEWVIPEGMDPAKFEKRARTLAHREHKKTCPGPDDQHDCKDWLTYTEGERHAARASLSKKLSDEQ